MNFSILILVLSGLLLVVLGLYGLRLYRNYQDSELLSEVTSKHRGTGSERNLVLQMLKSGRSPLAVYHDLYVPQHGGGFAQIDAVLATPVGIIVFEVKDYSGWIYGNGSHTKWTQVLAYGNEKYRFYNPIKQNRGHIKALKSRLGENGYVPYYSVIVFDGDNELKEIDFVPENTYVTKPERVLDVIRAIERENPKANYRDKHAVVTVLKECVEIGGNLVHQEAHVNRVKNMLGKHRIYN
ncbi:NERD domain-containing protein [Robiginitalea sp.]|nr:NERD domain-containing protein [Robiginitalea sp.]